MDVVLRVANVVLVLVTLCSSQEAPDPVSIAATQGYTSSRHNVVTADGFHLQLFRISNGSPTGKPAVLVQHGMFGNAALFQARGKETSLANVLVDGGFDVWLSSVRGSRWGYKHENYTSNSSEFWDFSWHEMGIYDLPAFIDYILAVTRAKTLQYVGYSLGVTMALVMGATMPQYNEKIEHAYMMGPVVYFGHYKGVSPAILAAAINTLGGLNHGMLPLASRPVSIFTESSCRHSSTALFCNVLWGDAIQGDGQQYDSETVAEYSKYIPDNASTKTANHYQQHLLKDRVFRQYNYGEKRNVQKYNSETPPSYNLTNVRFPISLLYGMADKRADPEDVLLLSESLPIVKRLYQIKNDQWTHLDFALAKDVRQEVYEPLLDFMLNDIK